MNHIVAEHKVIIIGCGHSGVINGVKLRSAGIDDFVILERADQVGGCWRENTYPGCACDVPSAFYSYSFRTNPNWSHTYATQGEILAYIQDTVQQMGLAEKLRLNTELLDAQWLEGESCWRLMTNQGEYRARFVVFATGPLTKTNTPNIDGIESFPGDMFHSAKWDHQCNLEGRRVAVVGTGASAIQIIPKIQSKASQLTVFQRTAPWVLPRPFDRKISDIEKKINQYTPVLQTLSRKRIESLLVLVNYGLTHSWAMKLIEPYLKQLLVHQVPDKKLRQKITADFTVGCKRIIFSNDYYKALSKNNVTLIASELNAVEGGQLAAANGESSEVDVIIFATGFDLMPPPVAKKIHSTDGRYLSDRWAEESPQAYLGTTLYDLPNAFLMVGPNILVYSSFIEIAEWQADYIVDAIRTMDSRGIRRFNLLKATSEEYNQRVQKNLAGTVFNSGGCKSYYLDSNGRNVASWPWTVPKLKRKLSEFDLISYQISR